MYTISEHKMNLITKLITVIVIKSNIVLSNLYNNKQGTKIKMHIIFMSNEIGNFNGMSNP